MTVYAVELADEESCDATPLTSTWMCRARTPLAFCQTFVATNTAHRTTYAQSTWRQRRERPVGEERKRQRQQDDQPHPRSRRESERGPAER